MCRHGDTAPYNKPRFFFNRHSAFFCTSSWFTYYDSLSSVRRFRCGHPKVEILQELFRFDTSVTFLATDGRKRPSLPPSPRLGTDTPVTLMRQTIRLPPISRTIERRFEYLTCWGSHSDLESHTTTTDQLRFSSGCITLYTYCPL